MAIWPVGALQAPYVPGPQHSLTLEGCIFSCLRKRLAARLLHASDDDLSLSQSDVGVKIRDVFRDDLRRMAMFGSVSRGLYAWVLALRAQLPHDTQDIEGANSILVAMGKAAPQMGIGLASARIGVKLGTNISVEECCELHDAVVLHMRSSKYSGRFMVDGQLPVEDLAGREGAPLPLGDGPDSAQAHLPPPIAAAPPKAAPPAPQPGPGNNGGTNCVVQEFGRVG